MGPDYGCLLFPMGGDAGRTLSPSLFNRLDSVGKVVERASPVCFHWMDQDCCQTSTTEHDLGCFFLLRMRVERNWLRLRVSSISDGGCRWSNPLSIIVQQAGFSRQSC